MVIILYSQFNPWGKVTMAVGILQIMIQVPTFLARAQISPMSDFISAGLVTGGLMKGASALANKAAGAMTQFSKYVTSDMYGARGLPTHKNVAMNNTPSTAANPQLLNKLNGAGVGFTPGPNSKPPTATPAGMAINNPLNKTPTPGLGTPATGAAALAGATPPAGVTTPGGPTGPSAPTSPLTDSQKASAAAKAMSGPGLAAVATGAAAAGLAANAGTIAAATPANKPKPNNGQPGSVVNGPLAAQMANPNGSGSNATGPAEIAAAARAAAATAALAKAGKEVNPIGGNNKNSSQPAQSETVKQGGVENQTGADLKITPENVAKTNITPGKTTFAPGTPGLAPPIAAMNAMPPMPGTTALANTSAAAKQNPAFQALGTANNGPNVANGRHTDPLTARVPVFVDDNPLAAANQIGVAVPVARGGQNAQGGARQLGMPGGVAGGLGGNGGGSGSGSGSHLSFQPPPSGGLTRGGQPIVESGMARFDSANYRWVPSRNLLTDMRTAQGPQQGDSADGKSSISVGAKGIASVRYGQGATDEQKSLMLMAAGYAGIFAQDPVAFDAARQATIDAGGDKPKGFAQNLASNWLQYSGGSFKSTAVAKNQFQKGLMEQAVLGSESYVNGQQGNAYTNYLRQRYGGMTADQQAWGIHMTTDASSPESGWSSTIAPANATLVNAGLPITAENRAAASNLAVMRQPQWARGQAVQGVAAYVGAMADQQLGTNAHPLERDAFIGRVAPGLPAATVEACREIMAQEPNGGGLQACAGQDKVNAMVGLMTSPDVPRKIDASTAYRFVSAMQRAGGGLSSGSQTVDVMSGGGGSGFGGGFVGGSIPTPPPMVGTGNAVLDAQFRDMTGSMNGNFSVPGASVYAPNAGMQANTIVRGPNGVGFANQTVNANLDVLTRPSGNNFALPSNLSSQIGPNIIERTDVNVHTNVIGDNDVHNLSVNVPGIAGRQEMNVVGGLNSSSAVSQTELDVHAEVIAPNGSSGLPPVGQFATMQDVQQETTTNFSVSNNGGGGSNYVQQGLAQVYLDPGSGAASQSSQLNSQVVQLGAQAAQAYSSNHQSANQCMIELLRAGVDDNAMQNPQVLSVGMQILKDDPSMLGSLAIATKVLPPHEISTQQVQVVQQMIDSGWGTKNITRPDVQIASMYVAGGGASPDPGIIRQIRQDPTVVPENTNAAAARGAYAQIPSHYFDRSNYADNRPRNSGRRG
jgi:hypothetical protein